MYSVAVGSLYFAFSTTARIASSENFDTMRARPERVVRPHVVERRVGVFRLPLHGIEASRFDASDRRRHVADSPLSSTAARTVPSVAERQPAGPLLEDVLVARTMALRVDGAAAEDRPEVEHVVLDPRASVGRLEHVEAVDAARVVVVQPRGEHPARRAARGGARGERCRSDRRDACRSSGNCRAACRRRTG